MAIAGLTDSAPSFKEIGRIRKGAPKSEGLQNLHYFRPDFRPDETAAYEAFLELYGGQPARIDIRLAFAELERSWDAYFTVYNTAGLLGKAGQLPGREGNHWIYLRDNKSGRVIVRDGIPCEGRFDTRFDPKIPIYSYKSKKGQDVAVYAKPEGRLSFMVPKLGVVGYVVLITHSYYDIARITSQLLGIQEMATRIGLTLPMVPLVLSRRPEQVSVTVNGVKSMREEWVVNVHVREDWAAAQFALLDEIKPGMALPAPRAAKPLELPEGMHHDEGWDDEPAEQPEDAWKLAQPPANGNGAKPAPKKSNNEQVAEQLAAAGQPPAPEPPPAPITLERAKTLKTTKGTPFDKLTVDQLIIVAQKASDEDRRQGAFLLLQQQQPSADQRERWFGLCEHAADIGVPTDEIPALPNNISAADLYRLTLELSRKFDSLPA